MQAIEHFIVKKKLADGEDGLAIVSPDAGGVARAKKF
jgi:phosphoribosylpyrophosphate synthetase